MNNLKTTKTAIAVLLALGASAWAGPAAVSPASSGNAPAISSAVAAGGAIAGDYVEARTAAVFAGACHYNGELVTTGRDALMAWNFTSGTQDGVSLAGVRVVAAISSHENLSDAAASHRAEIAVDSSATDEQVSAAVSLLKAKLGDTLGTVVKVRRTPITFSHTDQGYSVDAKGVGAMNVKYLPDDSCCVQAGDVWYEPLSPVQRRKVGYTETATYSGALTAPWYRSAENSAFYGQIKF